MPISSSSFFKNIVSSQYYFALLNIFVIAKNFVQTIKKYREELQKVDCSVFPSVSDMRGFMTSHGQPDQPRSARYILKDYVCVSFYNPCADCRSRCHNVRKGFRASARNT